MRKIMAATLLVVAAFGTGTASAGCWGVDGGKVCYSGQPGAELTKRSVCVYTGGDTCEEHYYPWVDVELPSEPYACVGKFCTVPLS